MRLTVPLTVTVTVAVCGECCQAAQHPLSVRAEHNGAVRQVGAGGGQSAADLVFGEFGAGRGEVAQPCCLGAQRTGATSTENPRQRGGIGGFCGF